ncbi:hypothetical protein EX30DRAFT_398075 [Ascodesmis nigricans]|uniref:Uncharacterized protein n=1 Tax=Ascodesmis nigricans TaxID=341454 RepID=A0A4S2MLT5_9PEZI|nr:hypothetical protein EX30DRAFT_398075 [Ascodesmis nigricans]
MDPLDDDDYVANLLKSEAKSKASDYSSRGLQAFLPSRPTSGAPKPNTRFLRNLVRDVDSHNAALREQEALNKSSRLRSNATARNLTGPRDHGKRDRHDSDRHHDKRRRTRSPSPAERGDKHSRHRSRSSSPRRYRSSHHRTDHKSHRSRRKDKSPRREEQRNSSGRHRRDRSRNRSRHRSRSRSPRRNRKSSGNRREDHWTHTKNCKRSPSPKDEDSSDPLEEIVGPLPPPSTQPRGRGAIGKSRLDERFQDSYDPSMDVQPDSDEDAEWDNAVEAFRDRLKWKQQGAERLRSAGFAEDFISAWENNATEDETKLKWAQKGATREWDRGKVVDDDAGTVELKAAWTRGKVD